MLHSLSVLSWLSLFYHDCVFFFFFNDTATTEIYTLSLHDALPISQSTFPVSIAMDSPAIYCVGAATQGRSEEHTSELQSQSNLVCRLLLEKKKKKTAPLTHTTTIIHCRPRPPTHRVSSKADDTRVG